MKLEHRFKRVTLHGVATELKEMGNNFTALEMNEQEINIACKQIIDLSTKCIEVGISGSG